MSMPTAEAVLHEDFHLSNLYKYFHECLKEDGSLDMDYYICAYEEVYKFLSLLGTVFGWVASDVLAKLQILQSYRKGENGSHYATVEGMVQYEVSNKMIKQKSKDSNTGSRNLLRLHRALEYINMFLEQLPDMPETEKCCHASQDAYHKTLAKHHPWVVQKAALMAMHMLPTKEGLIHKICKSPDDLEHAKETLPKAVSAMKAVYDKTQEIYKKHDILNLP